MMGTEKPMEGTLVIDLSDSSWWRITVPLKKGLFYLRKRMVAFYTQHIERLRGYPAISVRQCWHWNSNEDAFGTYWCPVENRIVLATFEEVDQVERLITLVLNHETLHWLITRFINRHASDALDNLPSTE